MFYVQYISMMRRNRLPYTITAQTANNKSFEAKCIELSCPRHFHSLLYGLDKRHLKKR